jgi:hypothetical protein
MSLLLFEAIAPAQRQRTLVSEAEMNINSYQIRGTLSLDQPTLQRGVSVPSLSNVKQTNPRGMWRNGEPSDAGMLRAPPVTSEELAASEATSSEGPR